MQAPSLALDSAGDMYVYDYARVLEFDNPLAPGGGTPGVPGAAGDATADRVLGQVDFTKDMPNMVDAWGLYPSAGTPNGSAIAVDSTVATYHLYVADSAYNRVLGWNDAAGFSSGAPADIVIGQTDLFSYFCIDETAGLCVPGSFPDCATGPGGLCGPTGLAVDQAGNLYVADTGNSRVLEYNAPFKSAKTAGIAASVVFGQAGSFTTSGCPRGGNPTSADTLCEPIGVAVDPAGNLYVSDNQDQRVLEYDQPLRAKGGNPGKPGSPGDTTADRVIGQSSFTSNSFLSGCGPSATSLCGPTAIAVDSAGNLYVGDSVLQRVVEFNDPVMHVASGSPGHATANRLFGASSFTSTPNCASRDSGCTLAPSAIAFDAGGNLYVADQNLGFVSSYRNPLAATVVATLAPLLGESSCDSAVTAQCLNSPTGLAIDSGGDVFVSDSGNNRVLAFDELAATGTLAVAPAPVGFGSQVFGLEGATSIPRLVKVSNTSHTSKPGHSAKIENIAITGAFAMNSSGSTCETGLVLAPGASCVLSLTFTPPGLGSMSGALTIDYGAGLSVNASLTGRGVAGVLAYTPKSINFGKVKIGSPANGAVTLSNGNAVDLGITAITSSDPNEFTVSQNCVGMLARNGGTCGVAVTFTPASKGPHNARLAIADDAANSPQIVTLSGTGD